MPVSALSLRGPASSRKPAGFVWINPRHAERIAAAGLTRPVDFLDLPGEYVGGHPDRNVARVTLCTPSGDVSAFLKRERRVPWKDRWRSWRDGYGWQSVSVREANTLAALHAREVPAPDWLAAGEAGGRAFLLLLAAEGVELRRHLLRLLRRPSAERLAFAERLALTIAQMHDAGVEQPDLYAKHILVAHGGVTILDWQRTRRPHRLSWPARVRDLAALHASIADDLADRSVRRSFLDAYCRASREPHPPIEPMSRDIESRAQMIRRRSSIREQRLPTWHDCQRLISVDGEALVVTPRCRQLLSTEQLQRLAYGLREWRRQERSIHLLGGDGRSMLLAQRRTVRPLGRLADWCRGERWTAPELRAAAHLLQQERLGAAPTLLAFGQRFFAAGVVDSFLLVDGEPA